jgi:hypothetical protein
MKTGLFYLGLVLSVLGVGAAYGFSEPEGVPWAEWRFARDFDAAHEISADRASDSDSLMRRNPTSAAISISQGKVVFTQTGPDDFLRVDIDDLVENGGGGYANEYTTIFDLKAMDADWLPIYNTGYNNYNAADFWVAADGSVGSGSYSDPGVVPLETWVRLVVVRRLESNSWVRDVYVDGAKVLDNLGAESLDGNSSLYTNAQQDEGQFTILSDSDATPYAGCELDNFAFVATTLSDQEIADLGAYRTQGIFGMAGLASEPAPADEATDVPRDTDLAWEAGEFAAAHDVYVGTSFDDVNAASRANSRGVLVSQGQGVVTYDPTGLLDFGQTYYWRIDEVNAAPDSTIFTGDVWSFTAEPFAYPVEAVTATSNGVPEEGAGPENTINGSGLNASDQHSTKTSDMWLANAPADEPLYIQYEFDGVYKLYQMLVWNYNAEFELILGFGLKDVTVEYSQDGTDWTALGDVELAKATAKATYMANTTIDFGGVAAKYVRLTVNSGWGMMGQFGLSEVRFMSIPAQARGPQPADGATDVEIGTALRWRSGREAVSHEVSLGTSPDALTLAGTVGTAAFAPSGLEFGSTYYWKVDEVNEADAVAVWPSPVWSFTVAEYAVVDNFESYNDAVEAQTTIYDTWIDGWTNNTGSTVGYFDAPFAERTIVHGGRQSMPLAYDNSASPFYSEAERTFDGSQDWTIGGADSLRLYFRGDAANSPQTLYITLEDSAGGTATVRGTDPDAILATEWQEWQIARSDFGGVNVSRIEKMVIGVGNRTSPAAGGTGIVYIDDIGYGRAAATE